jgi:GNAT superfamily N-acetyltransferase
MPVNVSAEQLLGPELEHGLVKLYDSSPEFSNGQEALAKGQDVLEAGGLWYVGWFNGKAVAAIMASGEPNNRTLHNIVVHPANRGRGIALRLVSEACRQEREQGSSHFLPGCTAIARLLRMEAAGRK